MAREYFCLRDHTNCLALLLPSASLYRQEQVLPLLSLCLAYCRTCAWHSNDLLQYCLYSAELAVVPSLPGVGENHRPGGKGKKRGGGKGGLSGEKEVGSGVVGEDEGNEDVEEGDGDGEGEEGVDRKGREEDEDEEGIRKGGRLGTSLLGSASQMWPLPHTTADLALPGRPNTTATATQNKTAPLPLAAFAAGPGSIALKEAVARELVRLLTGASALPAHGGRQGNEGERESTGEGQAQASGESGSVISNNTSAEASAEVREEGGVPPLALPPLQAVSAAEDAGSNEGAVTATTAHGQLAVGESRPFVLSLAQLSHLSCLLQATAAFEDPSVRLGSAAVVRLSLLSHLPVPLPVQCVAVSFSQEECEVRLEGDGLRGARVRRGRSECEAGEEREKMGEGRDDGSDELALLPGKWCELRVHVSPGEVAFFVY